MKNIIEILEKISNKYEETNNVTEKIFDSLKKKEYKRLPDLNESQLKLTGEVDKLAQNVKIHIEEKCLNHGIKEIKLSNLFSYMEQSEKEKILKLQNEIEQRETRLKNSLNINREMLKIILDTSKTLLEVVAHSAEQNEGEQSSVFLNQKF